MARGIDFTYFVSMLVDWVSFFYSFHVFHDWNKDYGNNFLTFSTVEMGQFSSIAPHPQIW